MTLSQSLRPTTFADVIGQDKVIKALTKQHEAGRFPQALMLTGPSGVGKTTLAAIVALSLQTDGEFGAPTPLDWSSFAAFSIRKINAAKERGIEQFRAITEEASYTPPLGSRYRIFIIEEAHMLTTEAQNSLLIDTEEPSDTTRWIFCTTNPKKLIPTLRSRFFSLELSDLTPDGIEILVQRAAKAIKFKGDLAPFFKAIAKTDIGSGRVLLQAFEKYAGGATAKAAVKTDAPEVEFIDAARTLVSGDFTPTSKLLSAADLETAKGYRLMLLAYLRSMVLKSGDARIARIIVLLTTHVPYDDGFSAWLAARLALAAEELGR